MAEMTLTRWMVVGSVLSWLAVTTVAGPSTTLEVFFGMLGPLLVTLVSWVMADRTYRLNPERLTALMITAFAAKLVFFGGYVAVGLGLLGLEPVPFVASFTAYYIALHMTEAAGLHRLFTGPAHLPVR
jgi:hypothetical protein